MLISSLTLNNFGIYNGTCDLKLAPKTKWKNPRPVVLIGGKNGSGKSTLFEAIKLCLYGLKSLDQKTSLSEYHAYLKSRINWFAKDKEASLKLTFKTFRQVMDFNESKEYQYDIVRKWVLSKNNIKEELLVYQENSLLDMDSSFWQDFVEELIPQGVIDLFFFDGEKIQSLAEGSSQNLEQSVKSLLNLSIIPSLSIDLHILYKKYLEKSDKNKTSKELKNLSQNLEKLKHNIEETRSSCASLKGKRDITKVKIERLEEKLNKAGGQYYAKKETLNTDKSKSQQKLTDKNKAIAKMCESHIPFLLAPQLMKQVHVQLIKDRQILKDQLVKDILSKKREDLHTNIEMIATELNLKSIKIKSLCDKISGYTGGWLTVFSKEKAKYGLDLKLIDQSIDILDKTKDQKDQFFKLIKDIEKLNRHIKKLEIQLQKTLESDSVIQIHQELNEQNQILGSQQKELDLKEKELSKQRRDHNMLKNKMERLQKESIKSKKTKDCYQRIQPIRQILEDFEKKLTQDKLLKLENEIYNCYAQISRKKGFIEHIEINPSTFEVFMSDRRRKLIPVDKLSAGEKQIYAISVLWALSKMSGRPLPMIIDTPLGRLDKDHRSKLIDYFFAKASHQVILLSTDTEIHKSYFEKMQKYISHSYNINFNVKQRRSSIKDGYLFSTKAIGELQ